jgi:3-methyladenine DNA glycosylase AlkD
MTDLAPAVTSVELFRALEEAADPAQAAPMAKYMKNQFRFLGVPSPRRKAVCRPFFRQARKAGVVDWEFVATCWAREEREFQYVGADYVVELKALLTPADLPRLRRLIAEKAWWDTADSLDRAAGAIAARYPEGRARMLEWARDPDLWVRRVAIDHQLLAKQDTDTEALAAILEANLGSGEFFIDKAIGWALRDYSKTDPAWVRAFLAAYAEALAPLSVREASKYL